MARMKQEDRKALAARRRAFREQQPDEPAVMEHSQRVALESERVEAKAASTADIENKADTGDSLENKSKDELYAMAQEQDIEGRSDMTKAELIEALR